MLDSPESATLAVTIIPVSLEGGVAAPGPHHLVRLDSRKRTSRPLVFASGPRCAFFASRMPVRSMRVAHLCLTMSTQAPRWMRASAKSMRAATYLLPF